MDGDIKSFKKSSGAKAAFIRNVYQILTRSEFIEGSAKNIANVGRNEIIVDVSAPNYDQEQNTVSYDLSLAKLKDKNLTLGTVRISADLDCELTENSEQSYLRAIENCYVDVLQMQTIKDVNYVELVEENMLII